MQGALSFDTLAVLTPARDIDSSGRHGPTRNPKPRRIGTFGPARNPSPGR
ncbi:hypothetical protein I553_9436 [Mycobacterium xenopi 4042]|uniref:Uncharacterized protein n=1 Tax=Mycobacterium xenopi 4042 TaxID=1299334 RepID=X8E0G0_MYCXE|nr:hypothetical protein I553_9436 [Mycobacterium xenopi 4042]